MCLAKLYAPGAEAPVMENIARITLENGKVVVESLFGETKVLENKIHTISFTDSRVQLMTST